MALAALDHVTLRTARLGELTSFYARVLGLRPGKSCRAEVNLEAPEWMRNAGRALRTGFLMMMINSSLPSGSWSAQVC